MSDTFTLAHPIEPPLTAENVPLTGSVMILDVSKLVDRDALVVGFSIGGGERHNMFHARPGQVSRHLAGDWAVARTIHHISDLRRLRRKLDIERDAYVDAGMPTDSEGPE